MTETGKVYLIGAGPGDPGLITLRGKEILEKSDVVVYDYLVNRKLLGFADKNAEIIYVGKKSGTKEMSQKAINGLLIAKARKGKTVARLKGGDPFVFGRGGEEAEALAEKGIPFEIVPGVTSASAVPAYAGIPLTHRDVTSSFAVVTGHEDPGKEKSNIPWAVLSKIGTVVFLMSVRNLGMNMRRLMDSGKPADTPAAVITWGTYPEQATATGTVGDIARIAKARNDISSPAIVVVGDTVNLRKAINWYERKPLFGKTVLVTRAREQAEPFVRALEEKGAEVIEFPVIEIFPPKSWKALDAAIRNIGKYDWIIFTSANGVAKFFERLERSGRDLRALGNIKAAAIGEVTAREIEKRGIRVDLIPGEFRAEGLIESFRKENISGNRILIPRALKARDILPETLRKMGATVDVVPAYETRKPGERKSGKIKKMLAGNMIDAVTFTSSSTVKNFLSMFPEFARLPKNPVIACIGPVTAGTLREAGCRARIVAREFTIEELAQDMADYFFKRKGRRKS